MKKLQSLILALGASLSPLSLLAHEGHGVIPDGPVHYLFSPAHLLPALILIAGAIWMIRIMFSIKPKDRQDFHA